MRNKLKPDLFLKSIYELDVDILRKNHIEGIIVDIDNTLVGWNICEPDEACATFIERLASEGFRLCILSNARKKRVLLFNQKLSLPAVHNAGKPFKRSFLRAMRLMGTDCGNTAIIGDQLFTDILGGKRLGLFTVLVAPISPKEFIWTRFVRKLERRILGRDHV